VVAGCFAGVDDVVEEADVDDEVSLVEVDESFTAGVVFSDDGIDDEPRASVR